MLLQHTPVLFAEVMEALALKPGGRYIDCTLGGGGHAEGILERTRPGGRLLALDRDVEAIANARVRLQPYLDRLITENRSFASVGEVARAHDFARVDGILLDLGVSLLQLSNPERGFSFLTDGPLDMRFDRTQSLRAADIVNQWPEHRIADLIHALGEEARSRTIARAIVRRRPLATTRELATVIVSAVRARGRRHPATRTFQALRIAVNDELNCIATALPQTIELLVSGGRLAVISFHSLEDRIVKTFFINQQKQGILTVLTRRPLKASPDEVRDNPRSRSARLRVAVRR